MLSARHTVPHVQRSFRKSLLLAVLACAIFGVTPAWAGGGGANILVVTGTDAPAITAGTRLNTDLGGTNTVTVVNTGVPVSLAGYTQIFDTRYDNNPNFSAGEQAQYLAFLNAAPGNTIFLMGENAAFNVRNTPINAFIALAGGGTVPLPTRTVNGPQTVNPPFTGPNALSGTNGLNALTYAACGLVASSGTGAFASQQAGGGCAIYFGIGTLANATQGALVVVYDVNFIYDAQTRLNPPNTGVNVDNEIPFRLNLEQFVSAPTTPPTVTSIVPNSGASTGGTAVTIAGAGFTGATGVTIGGTAATNVIVVSDASITATTPAGPLGPASVNVIAPGGVNAANVLFTYGLLVPSAPVPLQIFSQGPVELQVILNESLLTSGTTYILANQTGFTWQATTTTPWLTLTQATGYFPGSVGMSANAAGLAAGVLSGIRHRDIGKSDTHRAGDVDRSASGVDHGQCGLASQRFWISAGLGNRLRRPDRPGGSAVYSAKLGGFQLVALLQPRFGNCPGNDSRGHRSQQSHLRDLSGLHCHYKPGCAQQSVGNSRHDDPIQLFTSLAAGGQRGYGRRRRRHRRAQRNCVAVAD